MSFLINSYRFAADLDFLDTTSWFGDGVDDQLLSTSDFRSIDNGTQFSWSFWFKLDTIASNQTLIRLNTNTSTQGFHVFFRGGASLQLEAFVEGSSSNWTRSGTGSVKQVNKWYHVCVTLDNTTGNRYTMLKIYLDGVYQGNSNFFAPNMGTGTNLSFLANIDGTLPANANIDEIACWGQGTVLTATQVLEIFNKGLANDLNNLSTAPQPTNWWRSETATWNGFAWTLIDVNASHPMRSQNMLEANRENDVPSLYSNKSFSFDGVDDYIDCGNPTSLQITGALTLSAWIKTTDTSSYEFIIGKDNVGSGTRSYTLMRNGSIARFNIFQSNVAVFVEGTTTINDGNWHHVMGVNDGTDLKIYVDGTLDNTNVGGGGTIDNGTFNFNIGRRGGTFSQRGYFTGTIDEVAVWNSDQSANITSIFNQGVPTSLESLNPISHWRMGEDATWNGSQWTLNDNGSGGNNGTSQNMVLASRTNDVPLFNTKSILFDGVDDYVDCGNGASLQITGALTISAWVKTTNTNYAGIYSKGTSIIPTDVFFRMQNTGVLRAFLNDISVNVLGTTPINDGNWHHVMFVYVPSTSMTLYVDGIQDAQNTTSIPSAINNNYSDVYIGQFQFWDGNIDEVAVWDSEINISDVWDGSGKPFDISSSNPISWWRMGDFDSYPTLIDRGSGNNNGTMTNMTSASIVDDVPE